MALVVSSIVISYDQVQILNEDGTVRDGATVPDISDEKLIEMYKETWYLPVI